MKTKRHFPKATVAAIRDGKILGISAGTKPHRTIGIWAVVVEGRVFVRSWSLKPRSWYRTFLEEPRGGDRSQRSRDSRARRLHSQRTLEDGRREKFPTPGSKFFWKASKRRNAATRLLSWYRLSAQFWPD